MSTSQHDDERPEPRYGRYAPNTGQEQSSEGQGGFASPYGSPEDKPREKSAPQSPYGRNPYGDNPYSAPENSPYGTPTWGHPEQQRSSGKSEAWQDNPAQQQLPAGPVAPPKRPGTLLTALFLMLGAAILSLAWGIYSLMTLPVMDPSDVMGSTQAEIFESQMTAQAANDPQLQDLSTQELMEFMMLTLGIMALVWSLVLLAVYITMAFVGTMTGQVGRILATIWLSLSLGMLLLGFNGASYGIIAAVIIASLVALVMLWMPATNAYVQERRAYKERRRAALYQR
ncbi:hypothetical protein [Nesterenkonia flava]|uniref:DUF4064 domain-containing protein n=1 Tax=Nesterenkonia flava TaxID=469799 RepID=A0ABU1FR78_9MICC|nr:hypothetical protein [Nesterenkonia flava]MDR5711149.1 hypothetical protein [Nesterenkonia flava]